MKLLIDVSNVVQNRLTLAILDAFVRKGGELPDLYASTAAVSPIRKFLDEQLPGVPYRFFVAYPNPYADIVKWLEKGMSFNTTVGGLALRAFARLLSFWSRALLPVAKALSRRSAKKNSLLAKYDEFLTVYRPAPAEVAQSGLRVVSILPNPSAMKWPQKFLNDENRDWIRNRFKNLTSKDIVIPALDTCKEDMLVYGPNLREENVIEVAEAGSDIDMWADGVAQRRPMLARKYYINNWHNNAPRSELPRMLLIGDIAVMRFRDNLVVKYNVPVDGFGTSMKLDNPNFITQLKTFLYSHPYRYQKAVFMVGNHLGMKPAADMTTLKKLGELVGCEAMLASPLPAHMQEKKYVGDLSPYAVGQHRAYIAQLASRLGWRFIDVFQYVMEAAHTEESVAFCTGRSHVGMSDSLRAPKETVAKKIMEDTTELFAMALELKKDEGPEQKVVYEDLLKAGKIAPGEAKLEFEEWETLSINENKHCRYFFVGGCLLRDCCAASAKLKSKPTSEVYTSSHSIVDPAYIEGLKCMMEGKTYDVAYFNFGAHFFLHSREEFTRAFKEILSILKAHAPKVVLLTLPELASTGEADREECDFKNEKIRWANDQLLNVYSKEYPVVPVHQMALKYAAQRCDYFHFERSVYDALFREIQEQIGEPTE
ncbi:MAG: hypothetical protein KIH06_04790 [Kiritimatiellae bacterium]|nr:hypothetical protein [Kiritimatiellia bacterium]